MVMPLPADVATRGLLITDSHPSPRIRIILRALSPSSTRSLKISTIHSGIMGTNLPF
jgi:hypothetical protein